ncbi:Lysozyme RrrD [compost metagenome]
MAFKTTNKGISHLKEVEELRLRAYDDTKPNVKIVSPSQVTGVLTVGYGHTKTAKVGMIISEAKAEQLLAQDLKEFEKYVNDFVTAPITQNMFNALVSFCYNVGPNTFKKSSVLKAVNAKQYVQASKNFNNFLVPKTVAGRRRNEIELFLDGMGVLKYEYTKKKVNSSLFFDVIKIGFLFSI